MRVQLSSKGRALFFSSLEEKGLKLHDIAQVTQVSVRTVSDWKRGKYTIPSVHYETLSQIVSLKPNFSGAKVLNDWWSNSKAGKIGAEVRMDRHGALGTPEGRSLGGKNSYKNRRGRLDIFTKKEIIRPVKDERFAELIGILIGDGGMTKYQISVTTNSIVDYQYTLFIVKLISNLFGIKPRVSKRKAGNFFTIVASSINLVEFLKQNGISEGHKLKQGLDIPDWILEDRKYKIACLRGIFDTDGCIFQETHRIKGKAYSYPRLSFVSASSNLRQTIHDILTELEFKPKIRNNRSVNLEKSADITAYFRIVGTSNPKHASRFQAFGGVG